MVEITHASVYSISVRAYGLQNLPDRLQVSFRCPGSAFGACRWAMAAPQWVDLMKRQSFCFRWRASWVSTLPYRLLRSTFACSMPVQEARTRYRGTQDLPPNSPHLCCTARLFAPDFEARSVQRLEGPLSADVPLFRYSPVHNGGQVFCLKRNTPGAQPWAHLGE